MGNVYEKIDSKLEAWLMAQPMFFVGTAPLDGGGHVNLSPKGMAGTFAVLSPSRVAYLDYFGSGAETIAHVRENGRIVLMWCAFSGPPKIVRLHGRGTVVLPSDAEFSELRPKFAKEVEHAVRSIIIADVDRTSDSCGYSVPNLVYVEDRDILDLHHAKHPAEYYDEYARTKNAASIDGLPALG
jgi:hypothetical protein